MAANDHSFLPPSGAHAWQACALWATMNQQFPQDDSEHTQEGNAAHWVAWELLRVGNLPPLNLPTPAGPCVTEEMRDAALLLAETLIERRCERRNLHIEEQLTATYIHPRCYGTPDLWEWRPGSAHLEIFDLKFGHRFVDEYFNPQGLLYLAAILEKIKFIGDVKNITVSFTIIQPRCYYKGEPVRTHSFNVADAELHYEKLICAAVDACSPEPTATTNPACGDCPGRHACPALQQAAYSDAETSSNRQPLELTGQAAALELKMLERANERLSARVEGLREYVTTKLKSGEAIPFYNLEPTKPRERWKVSPEEIISMGQMLGVNLSKPDVLTPLQAVKAGLDEAVKSIYSERPTGSLKLVQINMNDVRKVFSNHG